MKYTVLFTLFAASTAFTPTFTTSFRASTSLSVSRRGMLESASAFSAAVVFAGASPALADGAVSGATKNRARGIYGGRIAALRKAVDAGDFGAVVAEKVGRVGGGMTRGMGPSDGILNITDIQLVASFAPHNTAFLHN